MSYRIPGPAERQVKISQNHLIKTLTLVQVRKAFWLQVVDKGSRVQIKSNALLGFDITSKIDPMTELSVKLYLQSDGNAVSRSSSVNFEPQMWDPCFKDNKIACYHIDRIIKKTFHQSISMDLDQRMWVFSTDDKIVFDPPLRTVGYFQPIFYWSSSSRSTIACHCRGVWSPKDLWLKRRHLCQVEFVLLRSGAFLTILCIGQSAKIHDHPLVVIKLEVEFAFDLSNSPWLITAEHRPKGYL